MVQGVKKVVRLHLNGFNELVAPWRLANDLSDGAIELCGVDGEDGNDVAFVEPDGLVIGESGLDPSLVRLRVRVKLGGEVFETILQEDSLIALANIVADAGPDVREVFIRAFRDAKDKMD